jgi:hypothetical protein
MDHEQFRQAVDAGLYLVNGDATVPTSHARGVVLLQEILLAFSEGRLGITAVKSAEFPKDPVEECSG